MKRRESSVKRRRQTIFAHASEGSDAESKSEMKWCGVPHWENQPKYTSELIGRALVEHGSREMLLWQRCGTENEIRWEVLWVGKPRTETRLVICWWNFDRSVPMVLFPTWNRGIPDLVRFPGWWVFHRSLHPALHMVEDLEVANHQRWGSCQHIWCVGWISGDCKEFVWSWGTRFVRW